MRSSSPDLRAPDGGWRIVSILYKAISDMYPPLGNDEVVELADFPQMCTGAPLPVLIASELALLLVYYTHATSESVPSTGMPENISRQHEPGVDRVALVRFEGVAAHQFGAPNDESLHSHPFYDKGLTHYAAHEVKRSSWIAQLERMNSVHPMHDPHRFAVLRHYILCFQDSTFECVAERYAISFDYGNTLQAAMQSVDPRMFL